MKLARPLAGLAAVALTGGLVLVGGSQANAAAALIRPTVPVLDCSEGTLTASILGTTVVGTDANGITTYAGPDGLDYDVYLSDDKTYLEVVAYGENPDQADVAPTSPGDTYTYYPEDDTSYAAGVWDFDTADYCNLPTTAPAAVYRFWSPVLKSHFFTMDTAERDYLETPALAKTWNYEGEKYEAFTTHESGTVPLYRFWSERLGGHFYTTDAAEAAQVVTKYDDATWRFEGVAYYVYPKTYTGNGVGAGTLDVARFFSPVYMHHFYTADAAEATEVKTKYPTIWSYEGIDFKVPVPAK